MTDVFISYKCEDKQHAQRLHDALVEAGLSVWWDRDVEGGSSWRQRIEQELDAARAVIVVWSRACLGEQGAFVRDEASRALKRRVLLPVRIDKVEPPFGFGEYQALDLVGWNGSNRDPRFLDVLAGVRAILDGKALPRPSWPSRRRRTLALSATGATFFAVLAAAFLLSPLQRAVCKLPGVCRLCASPEDCFKWADGRREYQFGVTGTSFSSEDAAKADALLKADEAARVACGPADNKVIRNLTASHVVKGWDCVRIDGYRCSLEGLAVCRYQQKLRAPACECER